MIQDAFVFLPYVQFEHVMAVEESSALGIDLGAGAEKAGRHDGGLVLSHVDWYAMCKAATIDYLCMLESCYVFVDLIADLPWQIQEAERASKG